MTPYPTEIVSGASASLDIGPRAESVGFFFLFLIVAAAVIIIHDVYSIGK